MTKAYINKARKKLLQKGELYFFMWAFGERGLVVRGSPSRVFAVCALFMRTLAYVDFCPFGSCQYGFFRVGFCSSWHLSLWILFFCLITDVRESKEHLANILFLFAQLYNRKTSKLFLINGLRGMLLFVWLAAISQEKILPFEIKLYGAFFK